MAALPQSNTMRWWAVYTCNGSEHRVMARTGPAATAASMSTVFSTLFANLAGQMVATTITGLEQSLAGSNIRLLHPYTGAQPTGTGTNIDNDQRARTLSFVGRTAGGHKSRLFVFGIDAFSEGDYRVDTTESTFVAAVVTQLVNTPGVFLGIDGLAPVWHSYANIGYNDHWIKVYRKG